MSFVFVVLMLTTSVVADDWPQWGGPLRDGVWRETGVATKLPPKLGYRWRVKIGAGYAGPAVAGGRVFVTDRRLGTGERNPDDPFDRAPVGGAERVLCLDADSGKELWKHVYACEYEVSYPAGPRATPTVAGGKVWTVGAMGHLFCLEAATGGVLWAKSYVEDFGAEIQTWGAASAPLIDGRRLILLVGGKPGALVVALDKDTGAELWRSLEEKDPGYSPPILVTAGGRRQLIVWTPEHVHSLDPATGKPLWKQPFRSNHGLSVARPVFDSARGSLLVSAFYNGPLMLEVGGAESSILWKGNSASERKTDKLHSLMCTPVVLGEHLYGVGSYGQLRCLKIDSGTRVWETFAATGEGRWWNAFIIPNGDRVFICNEQGELIIARLRPGGYEEVSRSRLIEPTRKVQRRITVWSHPAFANRSVYARNDREIVCADLSAPR